MNYDSLHKLQYPRINLHTLSFKDGKLVTYPKKKKDCNLVTRSLHYVCFEQSKILVHTFFLFEIEILVHTFIGGNQIYKGCELITGQVGQVYSYDK